MKELVVRTITGAFFVFLVLGSIWLHPGAFGALFLVVALLGQKEYYAMMTGNMPGPLRNIGLVSGFLVYGLVALHALGVVPLIGLVALLPLLFLPYLVELFSESQTPFINAAVTMGGIIYVVLPLALLNYFFYPFLQLQPTPILLSGFFLILWMNDTGAYLVGSQIGRNRLFERVSPKKSWEGSVGGAVVSLLAAYVVYSVWGLLDLQNWIIIALLIIIFGSLGDLVESRLKRSVDVKDSGSILPGHGGILDRFDAVLLASPMVFVYLIIINYY